MKTTIKRRRVSAQNAAFSREYWVTSGHLRVCAGSVVAKFDRLGKEFSAARAESIYEHANGCPATAKPHQTR
ncbi:MAG: hypothetical protein CMM86_01535 [Rhodovulum sp.]|nr:hypothetical protein [Rhodovulum sp.]